MKKQLLCILLAITLLFACMPAHARPLSNFFVRMRYGQLVPYENIPFRYAIEVYNGFRMYSEAELDTLWANLELDEDDDEVYDFRYWMSPDNTYEFVVQVKEQTYDSFATEIAHAPDYINLMMDDMLAAGYTNIRQLHDGILRQTPEGSMLETAYSFSITLDDGKAYDITVVYYDCYFEDIEYVFEITAYNGDYKTAQELLDDMVQTVSITSSRNHF